ncbi:MAG: outer membrane beta-barrel protein [Deltaproteobacteria bacterium]|nr:outer membrane beta-barrel protein [Deltaproteobacteria bacterium]
MKKLFLLTAAFSVITFLNISTANSQVPCGGGIIGIGPIGIGVIVDCPPPPPPPRVVVVKRPAVIRYAVSRRVVEEDSCDESSSCQRRSAPLPPPPASIPAAPANLGVTEEMPRLSLGAFMDSSSYEDGGLMGGGVNLKYMLSDNFGFELSTSILQSCTNCNEYASRTDARVGLSALYYLGNPRPIGFNVYLKGGFVVNSITFTDDRNGSSESVEQTNLEVGGGLEYRLTRNLSLNIEATGMIASETDDSIGYGPIPEAISTGIPSSDVNSGAFNVRGGVNIHF